MYKGQIISINIVPTKGQPMDSVAEIRAVPGRGLEGDRYYLQSGKFSDGARPAETDPDRQVTLIEVEAIEALQREYGIVLQPGDTRRNLVTRRIALNHLVDKTFRVGEVTLRGVRLCEPCQYLASMTQPNVLPGLTHRGGLRAEILTEGTIHVGDAIIYE